MSAPPRVQDEPLGPGERSRLDGIIDVVMRGRVLLSSYAALNLILFARVDPSVPRIAFLALALLGIGDGLRLTLAASDKRSVPRTFVRVDDSGAQAAAYLATYLLPLLAAPDPDRGDLFGYAIYAIVIVIIALRSELAHINPTLYLFGFRTVTVQDANGTISRLICRQTPNPGEKVMVTRMYGVLHRVA